MSALHGGSVMNRHLPSRNVRGGACAAALVAVVISGGSAPALAQILFATATSTPTPTPTPTPFLDHFTCYRVRTPSGTAAFVAVPGVSLVDQFRSSTVEVKKAKFLCAPTNKNDEDPSAPSHPDHLEDYGIKPATPFAPM